MSAELQIGALTPRSWLNAEPLPTRGGRAARGFRARHPRQGEVEGEASGSIDRTSNTYVRWVQAGLNRVLGSRLVVDGRLGSNTRSGIQSFQRQRGLLVDGNVGARTEAALIAAGAGAPPGGAFGSARPAPVPLPASASGGGATTGAEPVVTVNRGAVVSDNAIRVLKALLRAAGLTSATITSGRRDSTEQARVMYNLIERNGVAYAKDLYGSNGDKVIDVYAAGKAQRLDSAGIQAAMRSKIVELGPSRVSHHASDDHDVIDVAPSTIANKAAFQRALDAALAAGDISRYIPPPGDPAFHIEIPLARSQPEVGASVFAAPPLSQQVLVQEAEADAAELETEDEARSARRRRPPRPGPKPRPHRPKPPRPAPPPSALGSPASGVVAPVTPTGVDCRLASSSVERLRELLEELASTPVRTGAGGARVRLLRSAVLLDARSLATVLPLVVDSGCTCRHLSRLAATLETLPWPDDAELSKLRAELADGLRAAMRHGSAAGECR